MANQTPKHPEWITMQIHLDRETKLRLQAKSLMQGCRQYEMVQQILSAYFDADEETNAAIEKYWRKP